MHGCMTLTLVTIPAGIQAAAWMQTSPASSTVSPPGRAAVHQQLPWHPWQCLALGCPGGHLAAHCPPPQPPLLLCLAARPHLLRCSAAAGSLLPRLAGLVADRRWCFPTVPCPLPKPGAAAARPAHRRAAGPAAAPSVTAAPGPAAGVGEVRLGAAQRRVGVLPAAMLVSGGHLQVVPGQ